MQPASIASSKAGCMDTVLDTLGDSLQVLSSTIVPTDGRSDCGRGSACEQSCREESWSDTT